MDRDSFVIYADSFRSTPCSVDYRQPRSPFFSVLSRGIRPGFSKRFFFQWIMVGVFLCAVINSSFADTGETLSSQVPASDGSSTASQTVSPPPSELQAIPAMEFTGTSRISLDDMQKMGKMLSNGMSMEEATEAMSSSDTTNSESVKIEEMPGDSDHANQLTDGQIATGWLSLFDGETLYGWSEGVEKDSLTGDECQTWRVVDGTICVKNPENTFPLRSFSRWGNFRLECEIRGETGGMIGIEFPTNSVDDISVLSDWMTESTTKVLVAGETSMNTCASGFMFKVDKYGLLMLPEREWNRLTFVVKDGMLTAFLNGNQFLNEMVDSKRRAIVWNHYAQTASIRNVRILPLGGEAMLHDALETDWTISAKNKSVWVIERQEEIPFRESDSLGDRQNVDDVAIAQNVPKNSSIQNRQSVQNNSIISFGDLSYRSPVLRVTNGAGQLESKLLAEDFCFQTEVCVHGDALNSGVFFRCIPGDWMMGYECQIQNGMKNNDPNTPQDAGTGAIYRRQSARRIVAKDRQWFTLSILADEVNICTWVNGYPATCWTDTRKPDDNPRNGLRLRGGSIILQGHDPTTDIEFRRMRIAELPIE